MMQTVRALSIVLIFVTACGSKASGPGAAGASSAATVFPAARWVPAQPSYVISARTFADAQAGFTNLIDIAGMAGGGETSEASRELGKLLGVDPLNPQALAGIGIDLEGSMVVFSEGVNPTFVVKLDSVDAMTAFLEQQRERGLRTQSVVVAGTELFTAKLDTNVHISWAIDAEWMWLHFAFGAPDGVEWFENSRTKPGSGWVEGWKWASALATGSQPSQPSGLVGVFDPKAIHAGMKMPHVGEALQCARSLEVAQRVGLVTSTNGKQMSATVSLSLGSAAGELAQKLLPPPPGWNAAATNAPIAAQVNVDLRAAATWLQPCFALGDDRNLVGELDAYGVRTVRGFVHKLDPDEKEGVGAVALDLSSARFFRAQLDQIPGRSAFEKSRTFGMYKGKHVSVPFVGSGDYVLEESLMLAAMGDGVLAQVGAGTPSPTSVVMAVDVRPAGLSAGVWQWIFEQIDAPNPKRFAQRLLTWNDLHAGARIVGSDLLIEASGTRR